MPQGEFYLALGQKVREARKAAKVTQEQLARAVGLSRTSITNFEKGRQPIYAHVLVRVAQALGKDPSHLISSPQTGVQTDDDPKLRKLDTKKRAWVNLVISTPASKPGGDK
jgi:transcriptional regulator with XRE-family HTH domain